MLYAISLEYAKMYTNHGSDPFTDKASRILRRSYYDNITSETKRNSESIFSNAEQRFFQYICMHPTSIQVTFRIQSLKKKNNKKFIVQFSLLQFSTYFFIVLNCALKCSVITRSPSCFMLKVGIMEGPESYTTQ